MDHTPMKQRRRWRRLAAVALPAVVVAFVLASCGIQVSTTALPDAPQGKAYTATLQAENGKAPYTWTITAGALPDGLQLDAGTGTVSGTPTTLGSSSFTVQVTGDDGKSATQVVSLRVVVSGEWAQADQDAGRRAWAGAEKAI